MSSKPFFSISGRVTSYGYPTDSTPDTNSANGIGAWDNRLTANVSFAVSRDVEAVFKAAGIKPLDAVDIRTPCAVLSLVWADRTARTYKGRALVGRFDIYSPSGLHPLDDVAVTGFRRVS